jgi:thioredoxin 1
MQAQEGDARMKRAEWLVILAVIAIAAMTWGILGCGRGKPPSSPAATDENSTKNENTAHGNTKDAAPGVVVTFIELGSVNCLPCRMMQPVMRQVERKYGGQVKVIFYDVWTPGGRPYAQKYGIPAIPTQVFLDRNRREYYRHIGYFPFEEVEQVLEKGGVRR